MPDDFDYSQPHQRNTGTAFPVLTYGLCALCVIITGAHLIATQKGTPLYHLGNFGFVPANEIWQGKIYGLLTSFFIHGDPLHLLFNMVWLVRLGTVMELTLSPLVYIGFMLGAMIVGSGAELAISGQTGVGASGVVYAMFGLLWAGRGSRPEWRNVATLDNMRLFIVWGVFCVIATYAGWMRIANGAHGGGFLVGLSIGWLFFAPRRHLLWAIPLTLLVIITILSVTWMPWSWLWHFEKGQVAFRQKRFQDAIGWYERSLKLGGELRVNWHNIGAAWANIAEQEEAKGNMEAAKQAEKKAIAAQAKAGTDRDPPAGNE